MALAAQYPNGVPQDAVNKELDEQGPRIGLTAAEIAQAKTQFGPDPLANSATIFRNHVANLQAQQQLMSAFGSTGTQTGPGGMTVPVTTMPARPGMPGGAVTGGPGGVQQGLTPGETAQQVSVVDNRRTLPDGTTNPNYGQTVNRNLGDVLHEQGYQQGGGGPGPSPANPPRLRTTQATPAAPSGGVATSLPPGETDRLKASTDQYNTDNTASSQFQQRIFPLAQANSLLQSGDVTTGRGAEGVNTLKSYLQTFGTIFSPGDIQTIGQAKFDELNKYLTQVVNANPFAAASDARLASAVSGSPSAHISTLANQQVIKAMIGLERMRQASVQSFKQQGLPPQAYSDFQSKFAANTDPRAFVLDQLSPDQQKGVVATLKTPAQRKAFSNGLDVIANQPSLMTLPAMPAPQ